METTALGDATRADRQGLGWQLICLASVLLFAGTLEGCGSGRDASSGKIAIVAAENEYGSVASQVGGKYVSVKSIENNPNVDPHSYEISPGVAVEVAAAKIVVQNGLGYDSYMNQLEAASSSSSQKVIVVQRLLGLSPSTPNPHLWYKPATMPAVADALAEALGHLDPRRLTYFRNKAARFIRSLDPWLHAIRSIRSQDSGLSVATTEPVSDYLLRAAGLRNRTPFSFQVDIMNGLDPAPPAIRAEDALLSQHTVQIFVYNQQVTDSLTQSFIGQAQTAGVPIIGVYETMPAGFNYESWMLAETKALVRAITKHRSTAKL